MIKLTYSRMFSIVLAGSVALAIYAGSAGAKAIDPEEVMARADTNGDGEISWDEVIDFRSGAFAQLDRNGNGVISLDDRPRGVMAGRFDKAFQRVQANFDGDRDGKITREEMIGAPAPVFEKGDIDGDGVLTPEEIAAFRAQ